MSTPQDRQPFITLFACAVFSLPFAVRGAEPSGDIQKRAEQLWATSPVILCHTHPDPDDVRASIAELANAGVTAAVFNLTIDDGDWRSRSENYESIAQSDIGWGARFESLLAQVETLAKAGDVVVVKRLSDIPTSPKDVERARRARRVAIIIASEGSNQIVGPRQLQTTDLPARDTDSKSPTLESITEFKQRGWLSTALAHQLGGTEAGHRLLRPDGGGLNDYGRFITLTLMTQGVLVDLPHMSMNVRNEILEIAELADRPVMISHDNPQWLFREGSAPETLARLARSGHGTGLIGVHAYHGYMNPYTGLSSYAAAIDEGRKAFDALPAENGQEIRGDEHLALGVDWFFHKNMNLEDWAGRDPSEPLQQLVPMLMSDPYNYTDQQIKNILGENMLRMLRAAWKDTNPTR